jgi:hypothetical protein
MNSRSVRPDTLRSASTLFGQMNAAATPNNVYNVPETNNDKPFPVQLGTADPEDLKMDLRQSVVKDGGAVPGFGQAVADDRVFSYLERKKEAQIEADYRAWLISQTDFSSPEKAEFWNNVAPWITNEKIKQINENAELQKRLATLNVVGPKNDDDFRLLYMISNGTLRVPTKPVHEMDEDTKIARTDLNFVRGLFNPLAYTPDPYGYPKSSGTDRPAAWAKPVEGGGLRGAVNAFSGRTVSLSADDFINKMKR